MRDPEEVMQGRVEEAEANTLLALQSNVQLMQENARLKAEVYSLTRRISCSEARVADKNNIVTQIEELNRMELERLKKEISQLQLETLSLRMCLNKVREVLDDET